MDEVDSESDERSHTPSSSCDRAGQRNENAPRSSPMACNFSPSSSQYCLQDGQSEGLSPQSPPTSLVSPYSRQSEKRDSTSECDSPLPKRGYYEVEQPSRSTVARWLHFNTIASTSSNQQGSGPSQENVPHQPASNDTLGEELHHLNYHQSEDLQSSHDIEIDSSDTSCSEIESSGSQRSNLRASSGYSEDDVYSADSVGYASDHSSDGDDICSALFKGSLKSTDEAVIAVVELFLKHHLSKKSLDSIVKVIKCLLPQPNEMPSSGYTLFNYLLKVQPWNIPEIKHFYCSDCCATMDFQREKCLACGGDKITCFFEFPLGTQIKHFFENRNLSKAIDLHQQTHRQEEGKMFDIADATEYRKVKSNLEGKYDLVLLWNSDGVSLFHSSQMGMWPILATICEVSPHSRSNFLLVLGIWVDRKKPDMNVFLKPLSKSLNEIYSSGGVEWTHPESKLIFRSQIIAPALCADAPAKAIILNVLQFNARFGCNVCEQKAARVQVLRTGKQNDDTVSTVRRFLFQEEESRLRDGTRMNQQGILAARKGESRKGVKGFAEVSNIPFFDRATGVTAEYLHTLLLGCVKHITLMWINEKGPWYIGKSTSDLNEFLLSVRVPDHCKRLPRDFTEIAHWKASEFRAWLLFYSLPCVSKYLPDKYVQHWILLVGASFTLLRSDGLTDNDLDCTTVMLRCFVRDLDTLYGPKIYTYNFHNLLHLPLCVRRWGSLWATSAFPFENFNGVLRNLIHGTKNVGQELINNLKICMGFQTVKNRVYQAGPLGVVGFPSQPNDKIVLDSHIDVEFSENEKEALSTVKFPFTVHERVKRDSVVFTSRHYDVKMKRANSYVKFTSEKTSAIYGEILHFVKTENEVLCLVDAFHVDHTMLFYHTDTLYSVKHLLPCERSNQLVVIPLSSSITKKLIKAGCYLCISPNEVEINL